MGLIKEMITGRRLRPGPRQRADQHREIRGRTDHDYERPKPEEHQPEDHERDRERDHEGDAGAERAVPAPSPDRLYRFMIYLDYVNDRALLKCRNC